MPDKVLCDIDEKRWLTAGKKCDAAECALLTAEVEREALEKLLRKCYAMSESEFISTLGEIVCYGEDEITS